MRKIKVQTKLSYLALILLTVLALAFGALVVYIIYFADFASSRSKNDGIELLIIIFAALPILFKSTISKDIYVSDILLFDDYLELIYKKNNKEAFKRKIFKNEIKEYSLVSDISIQKYGSKSQVCVCITNNKITLNNGECIFFNHNSFTKLFGCPYQFLLDMLKVSKEIPNFKYRLKGDNEFAKKDVEHFIINGKRMSASAQFKYSMKKIPFVAKIVLGFCCLTTILSIGMIIYLSLPAMPLRQEEKIYMTHYNIASDLYTKKKYNEAITELNKAKSYANDNPEVYLQLAYNYQKLKNYNDAIKEAKEGLKYVNNKNTPYRKFHNFKFTTKEDISLYSIIAKSERKLENYQEAINAYTYIIDNSHYTYNDSHFWRGWCYYNIGNLSNAHKDFLEHKSIILKYFKDQEETEYKDIYPRYTREDLEKVNSWLAST
ncbi:MAG: hypothetical protein IJ877_07160 [Candidatus Gastranaerophilales bacterium]|nr:hypothetical protein [Candidatus Gastranaerophilales bacterium]